MVEVGVGDQVIFGTEALHHLVGQALCQTLLVRSGVAGKALLLGSLLLLLMILRSNTHRRQDISCL
jgi:hypothetical protein